MRKRHTQRRVGIRIDPAPPYHVALRDEKVSFGSSPSSLVRSDRRITVAVRCRPISEKERRYGAISVVEVKSPNLVGLTKLAQKSNPYLKSGLGAYYEFKFDHAFGHGSEQQSQSQVYETTTQPVIKTVLKGLNVTVFAYGATGAGKTYTMFGDESVGSNQLFGPNRGVIPRAIADLFRSLHTVERPKGYRPRVFISYLEIYNETIRDLLAVAEDAQKTLHPREDPVEGIVRIPGLTEREVRDDKEALEVIRDGNKRRETATTQANAVSSRSHAVMQVHIKLEHVTGRTTVQKNYGTLSLIDLAGSERARATSNRGDRLKEGANINRSLLALANCINTLATNGTRGENRRLVRVKYRDSKLTHLLKSSLEGNCRLVMLTCVGPAHTTFEESHNTLKYASRARNIKVRPVAQVTPVMPPPRPPSPENKKTSTEKTRRRSRLRTYRMRQQKRRDAGAVDVDSKVYNAGTKQYGDDSSFSGSWDETSYSSYAVAVAREQERKAKREILTLQKENVYLRQKLKSRAATSDRSRSGKESREQEMLKQITILQNRSDALRDENSKLKQAAADLVSRIKVLVDKATRPLTEKINRLQKELDATRSMSTQYRKRVDSRVTRTTSGTSDADDSKIKEATRAFDDDGTDSSSLRRTSSIRRGRVSGGGSSSNEGEARAFLNRRWKKEMQRRQQQPRNDASANVASFSPGRSLSRSPRSRKIVDAIPERVSNEQARGDSIDRKKYMLDRIGAAMRGFKNDTFVDAEESSSSLRSRSSPRGLFSSRSISSPKSTSPHWTSRLRKKKSPSSSFGGGTTRSGVSEAGLEESLARFRNRIADLMRA
eukprot:g1461.t1